MLRSWRRHLVQAGVVGRGDPRTVETALSVPRRAPLSCGPVDARTFLGMEPDGDDLHWSMQVTPQLTTPGNFLFGGCGLGAALVALEAASGRPTVWATGQYLSYALAGQDLDWDVTLAAVGGHVTQGRAVGCVNGR